MSCATQYNYSRSEREELSGKCVSQLLTIAHLDRYLQSPVDGTETKLMTLFCNVYYNLHTFIQIALEVTTFRQINLIFKFFNLKEKK